MEDPIACSVVVGSWIRVVASSSSNSSGGSPPYESSSLIILLASRDGGEAAASETIRGVSSNSKDKERGVTTVTGADRSLLIWGSLPVDLELDGKDADIDAAAGFRFVLVFVFDFFVIGLFWILMVFNRLYGLVFVVLLLLLGADAAADEAAANLWCRIRFFLIFLRTLLLLVLLLFLFPCRLFGRLLGAQLNFGMMQWLCGLWMQ